MSEKMRIFSTVEDIYKALEEGVSIEQKFAYSHPTKTGGKSIRLSLGRIWFNMLQPSDFPLVDQPVVQKDISKIIKKIIEVYSPEEASNYLTKINQETFRMSSYIPTSFNIDALILSDEIKEEKEQLKKEDITDPVEFNNRVTAISKKLEKDIILRYFQ